MRIKTLGVVLPLLSSLAVFAAPAPVQAQSLVYQARQYIGTNPTGRARLWCGNFINMVLRQAGYHGGGNYSLGYLSYGPRMHSPTIGSLAIMGRRRGGHIGVVSGIDAAGNPIIISGNTWGRGSRRSRVMEVPYPRGRILAYVMPH